MRATSRLKRRIAIWVILLGAARPISGARAQTSSRGIGCAEQPLTGDNVLSYRLQRVGATAVNGQKIASIDATKFPSGYQFAFCTVNIVQNEGKTGGVRVFAVNDGRQDIRYDLEVRTNNGRGATCIPIIDPRTGAIIGYTCRGREINKLGAYLTVVHARPKAGWVFVRATTFDSEARDGRNYYAIDPDGKWNLSASSVAASEERAEATICDAAVDQPCKSGRGVITFSLSLSDESLLAGGHEREVQLGAERYLIRLDRLKGNAAEFAVWRALRSNESR